ncbi:MAG: HlyD family secretion protein [Clostridium sp.]
MKKSMIFYSREILYKEKMNMNIFFCIGTILVTILITSLLYIFPKEVYINTSGVISNNFNSLNYISTFNAIVDNIHVKDGEYVAKGDLIFSLNNDEIKENIDKLDRASTPIETRLTSLNKLKKSIVDKKNYFSLEDTESEFYNRYEDYIYQIKLHEQEDKSQEFQIQLLNKKIDNLKVYLDSIEKLVNPFDKKNEYYYRYEKYLNSIQSNLDDEKSIINDEISTIKLEIKDSEDTLNMYRLSEHSHSDSNHITMIDKEIRDLEKELLSYRIEREQLEKDNEKLKIIAKEDGRIYFAQNYKVGDIIPVGKELFDIDANDEYVYIESYVPSNRITDVSVGDVVNINLYPNEKLNKKNISGTIEHIDSTPIVTNSNNNESFYIIRLKYPKHLLNEYPDIVLKNQMSIECNIMVRRVSYLKYIIENIIS